MSLWTPGGEVPSTAAAASRRRHRARARREAALADAAGAAGLDDLSPEERAQARGR